MKANSLQIWLKSRKTLIIFQLWIDKISYNLELKVRVAE